MKGCKNLLIKGIIQKCHVRPKHVLVEYPNGCLMTCIDVLGQ